MAHVPCTCQAGNYFNALYQGIPVGGYTKMISNLLDGIEVRLNTDYLENKTELDALADKVVYTGPIDAYFDYKLGTLEYRSVRFETETLDKPNFQGNAAVNYTDRETPWTRMNVELVVDKSNRVWPIDVGPRSGGNMIPDLLGDMFGVDIAEMSVKAAMGAAIKGNIHEPNGFYATHNLHSNKNGIYKDILFSPEIEPYIYRKYLYKKLGDEVEYFDNAAKCLGIVFFKFPDETTMKKILEHVNELITVELQ